MKLSSQQIFNIFIEEYVTQQNFGWSTERRMCRYRGDNGTKCIIGHLISDAVYAENAFEGEALNSGRPLYEHLASLGYTEKELQFIRKLQRFHDRMAEAHTRGHEDEVRRLLIELGRESASFPVDHFHA